MTCSEQVLVSVAALQLCCSDTKGRLFVVAGQALRWLWRLGGCC